MENKELLLHQQKLKSVYLRSKLDRVYLKHIHHAWDNNSPISSELFSNEFECAMLTSGGLYPEHLEYDIEDIQATVDCMSILPIEVDKHIVKKELLRKFFLCVLQFFLTHGSIYIDFTAYYKIPVNSIRFTTEPKNSGLVCKKFFTEP